MKNRRDISFTQGNMIRAMLLFSLPIIAGELLQNLYNSVDSLVVGNFAGPAALAAIGVCGTLTQLLVGFFVGMSIGSTVVVSKAFGRGDEDEVRRNIRYTFTFSTCFGILVALLAILLSRTLLDISGANEEVFPEALLYFRIYLLGLPFTVTYNSGAGALRALGDSRSPFLALAITSVVNIILDLLFTGVMGMGIAGVAIATVISQGISVAFICHRLRMRIQGRCFAPEETFSQGRAVLLEAFNIGFWAGMQSALISFSNLFVWRYINRFSTLQVAGISIGTRVDKFVNLPIKAYGMAMVTLVGQNRGVGDGARIRRGVLDCALLSLSTWILFGSAIYLAAPRIAAFFNQDATVIETAVTFTRILVPFYSFMAIREIALGVLRGFGRSTGPMVVTLIGMVGIRQLYLYLVMQRETNILYLMYGYPLGWFSAMILLILYALLIRKKLKV